jgi:hypothetical protein
MYSRFDTEARIAVAQATDLARELGHSQVGPDHLLLGLLANMRGPAYAALADHGLRFDAARDLVATHHTQPQTDDQTDDRSDDRSDAADGAASADTDRLDEDREALRAIGIDLDRVRAAVRENLGADLTDGWGSRSERGRRERRGRGRRHPDQRDRPAPDHGRGRRGPRSRRGDDLRFSPGLRDLLREVRRTTVRDRLEREPAARGASAGMTGQRLALALLESDDPVVHAVLATGTDLDGLRARLETTVTGAPTA